MTSPDPTRFRLSTAGSHVLLNDLAAQIANFAEKSWLN